MIGNQNEVSKEEGEEAANVLSSLLLPPAPRELWAYLASQAWACPW